MAPDSNNIAFLAGMIAAVPGVSALISAPRLGKLRPHRHLADPAGDALLRGGDVLRHVLCHHPAAIGYAAFSARLCRWRDAPRWQTLLLKYSSDSVTGRIFGYNQSFMYLGNVAGPLIGASVSAMAGFRWVFIATAIIVFINLWQLAWMLRQTRRANA